MTTVYYYSYFCVTENKTKYVWDSKLSSVCKADESHTIVPESITVIDSITSDSVTIIPEKGETNGRYRAESKCMTVPGQSKVSIDMTWPINIGVNCVSFTPSERNNGDVINCYVFPNTTIGVLGTNCVEGSNQLLLMSHKVSLIQPGFLLHITTPTGTHDCGQVTAVDGNTFTFENSVPETYNVGSLVQFTVNNIRNFILAEGHRVTLKSPGSTNSFIPKNNLVRVTYENKKDTETKFIFHYEYIY